MRVAITGASGFIGEEVVEAFGAESDVELIGISRQKEGMEGNVCWRATDYTVDSLKNAIKDVDTVIHLAAVRGTSGRLTDYSVNEVMMENLLIAMGECGIKRIVFASSIAVYSDLRNMPWTENMMLTPKTLYGITKVACEHLCMYYSKQYHFTYAIVRIAQVLGSGERRRVMTNVFMEQAKNKQQLHVMGRSLAKRQYIYSKDLGKILAVLAKEKEESVIINAGMDQAYTNLEIAELVNEVYQNEQEIDYDDTKPETIEPSIMDVGYYKEKIDYKLLSMKEALQDIARRNS